ncbi:Hypothetical protein D9617_3g023020 [Elsinoe fawcettii]|nr:Hypothetical protein D9617_3g023020 [Elsinoe fawcettii]
MDSSPPLPAHHSLSHPGSPVHPDNQDALSDYSLDLAALTKDSLSAPSSPPVMRKVDEVRSEDIDGPSDFTLHMEEWMRGTRKGKPKSTLGRGTQRNPFGTMKKGTVRTMFSQAPETQIEEEEAEAPQTTFEDEAMPTRERQTDTPVPDSSVFVDDREGSATPRVGNNSSMLVDQAWAQSRRFLQPTVEDYNSDLTPGRPLSAPPLPRPSPLAFMDRPDAQGSPVPVHGQQDDVEAQRIRRELEELRMLREKSELRAQHFEDQLRASNDSKKELQNQLDRTTDALRTANEGQAGVNAATAQTEALERQLLTSRGEAEEARKELIKAKSLADELRTQLAEMRESEDAELHDLRWRVKGLAEGERRLTTEIENLNTKLNDALEESTRLRADLDGERTSKQDLQAILDSRPASSPFRHTKLEAEVKDLKMELQNTQDQAASLRDQLQERPIQRGTTTTKAELDSAKQEIIDLREELNLLQDLSRLDEDELLQKHARTESTTSSGEEHWRTQLEAVLQKAEHFEKMAKDYSAQTDALRSDLVASKDTNQQLRKDLAKSNTVGIGVSDADLRESERKRLDLHATIDEMRKQLEGLKQANEQMDRRVSESLRKREETWKIKEQEWLRERKTMAKALMRQWGREEMGIDHGEEQRYKYQFLGRTKVVS